MSESELVFGRDDSLVDAKELERFLAKLDQLWDEDQEGLGATLDEFRSRLYASYETLFVNLHRAHAAAVEAAAWGADAINGLVEASYEDDDDEDDRAATERLDEYHWLMRGLVARSITAFAEIAWLLQGGFPDGALGRVRTLHELAVVATVIAEHGNPDGDHPELVRRYARHHEVFVRETAAQISSTGMLEDDPFDDETLRKLDEQRAELLHEFGKKFSEPYGWAQPLFSNRQRISFTKLAATVAPNLAYLYRMTSSHVHADSEGWQHSIAIRGGETLFAAGPTNVGLGVPAELACNLLSVVLDYAVPAAIRDGDEVNAEGSMLLAGVRHSCQKALAGIADGEAKIEERERELQREQE